jgi:hypothetical protein
MDVVSKPQLPTDWSGVRIRLRRHNGWLWRWYWTVSNGIMERDGGFALTHAAAVRRANKAAAKVRREQAWDAEEEVWEFDGGPTTPDRRA